MDLIDLAVTMDDPDLVDEDDSISLLAEKKSTNLVGYDSDSIVDEDKEEDIVFLNSVSHHLPQAKNSSRRCCIFGARY